MRITPISPVLELYNRHRRSIFNNGGWFLKRLPYEVGDRVECCGFEGKLYIGTVIHCEHVDAGYAKFVRIKVKLDKFGNEIQINWNLFPDRIRKLEEKKK